MVFKLSKPKEITMYNDLYVPKLASLFSVGVVAATKRGTVKFGDNRCRICDRSGKLLGTGSIVDKIYHLDCKAITQEQIAIGSGSRVGNKVDILHQQLGYRNEQQLKKMVSQDLAKRVKISKFAGISSCKQCV